MTVAAPRDPEDTPERPAGNWRRMHRGWGEEPKRRHRTWLGAAWHLRAHRKRYRVDADLMWVYPCWFTDANGFGRRHYHVGHLPKLGKLFDPERGKPRPGTLFLGVFAVEDGFEARTFEGRPATCYPARPTVAEALREYEGHAAAASADPAPWRLGSPS